MSFALPLLLALGLAASPAAETPSPLAFRDLLVATPRALMPSAAARALEGKRVTMVGFMAQMELPPRGAFYLVPRPVSCDEGGAGSADLPPEAVRVVLRSARAEAVEFIPRPIEVTGTLEIGPRAEEDGRVSHVRIVLDGPAPAAPPEPGSAAATPAR